MIALLPWALLLTDLSGHSDATNLRGSTRAAVQRQLSNAPRQPDDTPKNRGSRDGGGNSSATDPAIPEQIHIALASAKPRDTYAVSVSWVTWEDTKSQVFWGRDEDALTEEVTGNSSGYTVNFTNPGPAYSSGRLHSATLEGLEPSGTFYYSCGDKDLDALSTVRQFSTSGAVGAEQTVTFGVLGDLGQANDSRATINSLSRSDSAIELVLHAGDLSYADCQEERWDSFLNMLDPVASRIPWMVAAGNHEIEADAGSTMGGIFTAYEHRFRMPAAGPAVTGLECGLGGGLDGNGTACGLGLGDTVALKAATDAANAGLDGEGVAEAVLHAREAIMPYRGPVVTSGWPETKDDGGAGQAGANQVICTASEWSGTYDFGNSFYSFDVASVHVVVLNPYTASGEGSLQQSWLIADLGATDRSLTPWIIVMFHCPWYNSNLDHQAERQALTAMRTMESLLFQHRVALIISGHVHAYERSFPVLSGQLADGAPVYVVVGGAGNREQLSSDFYRPPDWSAFRNGTAYGAGILSVMNSTTALWQWKSNDKESVIHDSAWISNPFSLEED